MAVTLASRRPSWIRVGLRIAQRTPAAPQKAAIPDSASASRRATSRSAGSALSDLASTLVDPNATIWPARERDGSRDGRSQSGNRDSTAVPGSTFQSAGAATSRRRQWNAGGKEP
jgi:hypothetical protein